MTGHFDFYSKQHRTQSINGHIITRSNIVNIKNGKGTKAVIVGKRRSIKRLSKGEIKKILNNQFVPGLFKSCEAAYGNRRLPLSRVSGIGPLARNNSTLCCDRFHCNNKTSKKKA